MRRKWWTLALLLGVFAVLSSWLLVRVCLRKGSPDVDRLYGVQRMNYLQGLARKLETGMGPEEVKAIMGVPDNKDTRNVWIWDVNEDRRRVGEKGRWVEYCTPPDSDSVFLVFDEGRLVTPTLFKTAAGSPWETFQNRTGKTSAETVEILGPKPWVEP